MRCVHACLGLRPRGTLAPLALLVYEILPSSPKQGHRRPGVMGFRDSVSRPALSPINASASPSRATPHDSGTVWLARLFTV
jgi:hypothetical protein